MNASHQEKLMLYSPKRDGEMPFKKGCSSRERSKREESRSIPYKVRKFSVGDAKRIGMNAKLSKGRKEGWFGGNQA